MKRGVAGVCALLVVSACAVPHERSDVTLGKDAARTSEVDKVFERYRQTRNAAIALLDPKPLSTVESEAVFDIDSGSFDVSQRLAQKQKQDTPSPMWHRRHRIRGWWSIFRRLAPMHVQWPASGPQY